jgi:hypothetical protein
VGHEQTPSGIAAGKSDPGPAWSWQHFFDLLSGGGAEAPETPVSSREEIIRIISQVADETGIPRDALLGLAISESNLDPFARRPRTAADDERSWPDVSGGIFQPAVKWTKEYQAGGFDGSYPGPEATERILQLYYDPEHAARTAAPLLKHYLQRANGDPILAMLYYNGPNKDPVTNPNRGNYERGWREARAILGD